MRGFRIALLAMHAAGLAAMAALSGSVQDRITSQPIAGAVVTWVEQGASDTTDADGRFGFSSTAALVPERASDLTGPSPRLRGQGSVFTQRAAGSVRMDLLDLAGKVMATPHHAVLGVGTWFLPFTSVPQGMYLCRITAGGRVHAFPVVVNGDARNNGLPERIAGGGESADAGAGAVLARRAAWEGARTLITRKPGYHTDSLSQDGTAEEGILVSLLDTASNVTCGTHTWACWPMPNPASSGLPRPAAYTAPGNGVVLDKVTRLRWQKVPSPVKLNWSQAHTYCDTLKLAGLKWRLPTRIETMSLVDFTRTGPAIDKDFFSSPSNFFHTASPWILTVRDSTRPKFAWVFNFYEGLTSNAGAMANAYEVRCLQDDGSGTLPAARPKNPYTQVHPGEMRDSYTGLIWQRGDSPTQMDRNAALAYCAELRLNGRSWRLPSIKEASTLVDETRVYGALDTAAFPGTAPNQWYWSSSAWAGTPGRSAGGGWGINFDDGFTGYGFTAGWARCVR